MGVPVIVWMRDWEKLREDCDNESSFGRSFRISLAISRQIYHIERRCKRGIPWCLI